MLAVANGGDSASSIRRPREFHLSDKRVYCHEDRTHLGLARDALAGRPIAIRSNCKQDSILSETLRPNARDALLRFSQENSCTILAEVLPWLRKEALEVESNPYRPHPYVPSHLRVSSALEPSSLCYALGMKCADPSTAGYCVQPLNSPKVCLREGQLNWTRWSAPALTSLCCLPFPITAPVLGWVEDSVVRSDSRGSGVGRQKVLKEVAERVGIGFELPIQSSVVAPNAPKKSTNLQS